MEHDVRTPDGRKLHVLEGGDPDGLPVVVHHGTPGGALQYEPHAVDAAERGIRLLSYDRPGYGGSTPHEGRSVADAAADVSAIADALGIGDFGTYGGSGGGPHTLACAALLPDRVVGAVAIASVAPFPAEGLDWLARHGPGEHRRVRRRPGESRGVGASSRRANAASCSPGIPPRWSRRFARSCRRSTRRR